MRYQPAMIAINVVFAAITGFWTVQNIVRGDYAMASFFGIVCVINAFIAFRRYQTARMHDQL